MSQCPPRLKIDLARKVGLDRCRTSSALRRLTRVTAHAADHRRRGIGKLLMQHVCQVALDHGCSRVEWTLTDVDNGHAQAFYDDLSLPKNQTKIFYRLEGCELDRVTDSTEPAHDQ